MYQALYRKYRPKNFDTVYGQDIIVKTLKNSIIHKTFSHAYLFYGPRGTGKTTFSKIFAFFLNKLEKTKRKRELNDRMLKQLGRKLTISATYFEMHKK